MFYPIRFQTGTEFVTGKTCPIVTTCKNLVRGIPWSAHYFLIFSIVIPEVDESYILFV